MIKRIIDVALSAIGLLLLSPVIVVVGLLAYHKLGRPIIFRQMRPGKNGKPFMMLKFRTMVDAYDADGKSLTDADRLTPFGGFLRSSSLDELPELWNVFKGDMSLIGPRPLLMDYLPLYNKQQFRRHEVRPGITGWAQIKGRNSLSWEEKFELDIWYVDNQSLWLDVKILFLTVFKVIKREGISGVGEVTMSKFIGNGANKKE